MNYCHVQIRFVSNDTYKAIKDDMLAIACHCQLILKLMLMVTVGMIISHGVAAAIRAHSSSGSSQFSKSLPPLLVLAASSTGAPSGGRAAAACSGLSTSASAK